MSLTTFAGTDVTTDARALLNDQGANIFTDVVLLPLLKILVKKLNQILIENGVKFENQFDNIQTIAAVTQDIVQPNTITYPILPSNLLQPVDIAERPSGATSTVWVPMVEKEWEPYTIPQSALRFWTWRNQTIYFPGATVPVDVLLKYRATMLSLVNITDIITLVDGQDYLSHKLGAYAARFIGEDIERADSLEGMAEDALFRILNNAAKERQSVNTRHQPFRVANPIYRRY